VPLKNVLNVIVLVNHEVMPLEHVLGVIDLVNHSATPKLWAIVHENGYKRINDEFFLIPL
jgi:hypothetical protein